MVSKRKTYLNGVIYEVITVVLVCGHVRHGVVTTHGSRPGVAGMRIWSER